MAYESTPHLEGDYLEHESICAMVIFIFNLYDMRYNLLHFFLNVDQLFGFAFCNVEVIYLYILYGVVNENKYFC